MDNTTLQEKLIHSLNDLLTFAPKPSEIKRINTALKNVIIPDNDYRKVFNFILLLLRQRPDLMSNPKDTSLKELCLECINKCSLSNSPTPPLTKLATKNSSF